MLCFIYRRAEGAHPGGHPAPAAPAPTAELWRSEESEDGPGNLKENENCVSVARVWESENQFTAKQQ